MSGLVTNEDVWGFLNIKFVVIIKLKSTLNCVLHHLLPILFLNIWPILVSLNRDLCFFSEAVLTVLITTVYCFIAKPFMDLLFSCSQSVQLSEPWHRKEAAMVKDCRNQEIQVQTQNPSSAALDRQGFHNFAPQFSHLSNELWGLKELHTVCATLYKSWCGIQILFTMLLPSQFNMCGLFFKKAGKTIKFGTTVNESGVVKARDQ